MHELLIAALPVSENTLIDENKIKGIIRRDNLYVGNHI